MFCFGFFVFFFLEPPLSNNMVNIQEDPVTHERVIPPGKAEKTVWALCERRIIT